MSYQKSIFLEFDALKNRVSHLIGDTNWGETGRYREVILIKYLKNILPNQIGIGTGFVKKGDNVSTQIDIILYNPTMPIYFKEQDFVIIPPESVLGIIEVKSNPNVTELGKAVEKANKIGDFIGANDVFNGIFVYGEERAHKLDVQPNQNSKLSKSLKRSLSSLNGVNHILIHNSNIFLKKWGDRTHNSSNVYSAYKLINLGTGYFFSNLIEFLDRKSNIGTISETMYRHLYPIEEGKEHYLLWNLE